MYKIKINNRYKEMNNEDLRKFYINLCNNKMQEFIGNGNEWGKWFFRYEDAINTSIYTIIKILEEENFNIKVG